MDTKFTSTFEVKCGKNNHRMYLRAHFLYCEIEVCLGTYEQVTIK